MSFLEKLPCSIWSAGFALMFWLIVASPAAAFFTVVTSEGSFKVDLATGVGNDSFSSADAANSLVPFTQTPWFKNSDKGLAREIAEGVRDILKGAGVSYRVPWKFNGTFVEYAYAVQDPTFTSGATGRNFTDVGSDDRNSGATQHAWITEVPEIDGPILAQSMFVLGALYFLLRGNIRRRQPVV